MPPVAGSRHGCAALRGSDSADVAFALHHHANLDQCGFFGEQSAHAVGRCYHNYVHRILQFWSTRRTALLSVRWTISVCHRPSGPGSSVKETFRPAITTLASRNKLPAPSRRQDFSNSPSSMRLLSTATNTCMNDFLSLCRAADGNLPSAQKEMMSAKTAPIRLEQPMKGSLHGVPGLHHSKIDRLAVRALG